MVRVLETYMQQLQRTEQQCVERDMAQSAARARPLADLSPDALALARRTEEIDRLPTGTDKNMAIRALDTKPGLVEELQLFRQAQVERYGNGRATIDKGLADDPAVKSMPARKARLVSERVDSVLQVVPLLTQMREQIRWRDRELNREKTPSRSIER